MNRRLAIAGVATALLGYLFGPVVLHAATCTGATPCNACKNCSSCARCKKNGGTCGVCKRRE